MGLLTASFLLFSPKFIFWLHLWSSKKLSSAVTIHSKDSLLLLMPLVNSRRGLKEIRKKKYNNIFAASEGHLACLHRGMPIFLSSFCFKQGDLSGATVTSYNYRNKTQNTESWMKNASWEQISHYQRPCSDSQPRRTAHKGLFQSRLSVPFVPQRTWFDPRVSD